MLDRRRLLGLAAALALGACATGPAVRTDFDPQASFAGLRTYTWAHDTPQPGVNPLTWQRTRDAIDRNLQARGFTPGQPGQFAVGFTLGRRDRLETWNYGPYYAGWGRWGGMGWTGGTQVRTVTEGTLTIDVFDVATRRPMWTGSATRRIGRDVSQADIDAAVNAVLARFPPTP